MRFLTAVLWIMFGIGSSGSTCVNQLPSGVVPDEIRRLEQCTPEATQCRGNVAEICLSDGHWDVNMDCDRVTENSGLQFVCCPVETFGGGMTHACMPGAC